jgi:hypothetical protein
VHHVVVQSTIVTPEHRDALDALSSLGVRVELRVEPMTASCRLSTAGRAVCVLSPEADDAVARALHEWEHPRAHRGKAAARRRDAPDVTAHRDEGDFPV